MRRIKYLRNRFMSYRRIMKDQSMINKYQGIFFKLYKIILKYIHNFYQIMKNETSAKFMDFRIRIFNLLCKTFKALKLFMV